jgi:hypothetical protein
LLIIAWTPFAALITSNLNTGPRFVISNLLRFSQSSPQSQFRSQFLLCCPQVPILLIATLLKRYAVLHCAAPSPTELCAFPAAYLRSTSLLLVSRTPSSVSACAATSLLEDLLQKPRSLASIETSRPHNLTWTAILIGFSCHQLCRPISDALYFNSSEPLVGTQHSWQGQENDRVSAIRPQRCNSNSAQHRAPHPPSTMLKR